MSPSPSRAILALLGAVALLTGCGGGAPDPVTDKDATLRLRLDEYRIRPAAIKVRSGRIRILARNVGRLTHNVRIEEATDEEGATPIVYATTKTMQPGERAPSKTITLFPGTYRIVCTIQNHENLGQYAELVVTQAP